MSNVLYEVKGNVGILTISREKALNALNSEFLKHSVTSCIIKGFLKSGLSIPYFSIASLYGIRTNGPLSTFQVVNFPKVYGTFFPMLLDKPPILDV